jgi:uncharacterized protein (DUF1330 family)
VAKGFVILTEAIRDPAMMAEYGRAAAPSLAEFDAKVLVADRSAEVLEGAWHGNQTVIVEFDSVEKARAWYESDSYRAAASLRQAAADCNVVVVAGFTPRAGAPE